MISWEADACIYKSINPEGTFPTPNPMLNVNKYM